MRSSVRSANSPIKRGTPPVIRVTVTDEAITVADNGPGLAPETVAGLLDYDARVSSREAYASPTRGAQGNALKTILAMPFVLGSGAPGVTQIESRGIRHTITFSVDPVRQIPQIDYVQTPSKVKIGASVTVHWPNSGSSILGEARTHFSPLYVSYAVLNPHASFSAEWAGERFKDFDATDPTFRKWVPSQPTSPRWYSEERFARLIGNFVADAEDRGVACLSVRDFIGQFRGLSATAKARDICELAGIPKGAVLADICRDAVACGRLHRRMSAHSATVRGRDLGVIGKERLAVMFERFLGCAGESFRYRRVRDRRRGGRPGSVRSGVRIFSRSG